MRSEAFAAARGKRLDQNDVELQPVVAKALQQWSSGGDWYADIVEGASVLWRELFEESAPDVQSADEDALMAQFQKELGETLAKTGDPDSAAANQAQTITYWVSTYTANNAEIRAQRFNGHPRLRWVTRHDDHVRSLHAAMDGKTVPSGQKFDLGGGVFLAYPGEPEGPLEYWINCRCLAQRDGEGVSMAGNRTAFVEEPIVAAATPNLATKDPEEMVDGPHDPAELVDVPQETPFHGVAAPTDTPSGDGRQLAKAGFSHRTLPLPFAYQRGSYHGGDPGPAVTVGRIDAIWLDDQTGLVNYAGAFSPNIPEAAEAIQHIVDGTITGVSVDVDNSEVQMKDPDEMTDDDMMDLLFGGGLTIFSGWRIAGITMVSIPAFQEATVALGKHPDLEQAATLPNPAQAGQALAAGASFGITSNPSTHDGPGWITDPVPTGRIRRYWTEGEGKAKIAWGVDGDFDRCRAHLGKYVEPQYLAGTCANMHKEATGAWPGHAPGETRSIRASLVAAGAAMARAVNIVVEQPESRPPLAWFQNPELTKATPFTVTEDGRVFGHVATWGTCHIGYSGVCTTAPTSSSNYAYYRTGAVATDGGDVAVGHITMEAGHAPLKASAGAAMGHYDNTATVVADVAAGEDSYGIWVAGAVRPGLSDERRHALKAAALSGDWRSINGNLEMVAALAVNVPGFPIPRTALAASGEHQDSLVAAGVVAHEKDDMAETIPAEKKPAPAEPEAKPETTKPQAPGDEAVNSAVETLHSGLQSLSSSIDESSPEGQKLADLLVTSQDLMKYLGLDKPEPKAEPAPEKPVDKAVVASMLRRETEIGPRREAARQKLATARLARKAERIERAKSFRSA